MNSRKFDQCIFFLDQEGNRHFLLQVINIGKSTDELKFIFVSRDAWQGGTYTESKYALTDSDIIFLYAEVDYHSDGSVLFKFLGNRKGDRARYRNPAGTQARRTPLAELGEWEPVLRCTVVDYALCKPIDADNALVLPSNELIFNGHPFVCVINLGHMAYANPPNNQKTEMLYRINDVASDIDLLLWIYKTDYRGKLMRIGNSNQTIFLRNNVIEVVGKRR